MTWGYRMYQYRQFTSSIFQVLATIIFNSEDTKLSFEQSSFEHQAMFFLLFLTLIYITRMAILAQMISFYLESYRRKEIMIKCVKADGKEGSL